MSRAYILEQAVNRMRRYPELRFGQCVFNIAADFYPVRAMALAGTDLDPFYNDSRVAAFLDALASDGESR